jgi:hypothetical protein
MDLMERMTVSEAAELHQILARRAMRLMQRCVRSAEQETSSALWPLPGADYRTRVSDSEVLVAGAISPFARHVERTGPVCPHAVQRSPRAGKQCRETAQFGTSVASGSAQGSLVCTSVRCGA